MFEFLNFKLFFKFRILNISNNKSLMSLFLALDLYIKEAALQGSNSDSNPILSLLLALCLVAYH